MNKRDYYEVLGLNKGASADDIKKAHRAMVKKYHPDNNPDDAAAEEKYKEANEAYGVLSDADKKAKYDQFGHAATGAGGGGGGFSGFGFDDIDLSDILRGFAGFGGGASRKRGPAPGNDVEVSIQVELMDAVTGVEREVNISIKDTCDTCRGSGAKPGTTPVSCQGCNGSGQVRQRMQTLMGIMETTAACKVCRGSGKIIKDKCNDCTGSGKIAKPKTIVVKVPKGIENGQHIKYSGQGEAGEVGAPKGDLYVRVLVAPHMIFKRRGVNLHMDKPITFTQAALGAEIIMETPYGDEKYTIPAGTQPGTVVTLRGKGMPHVNAPNRSGDLTATLSIAVPKNLTEAQKELLRQFAAEGGENIENGKKGIFGKRKKN
ncbi:MAG: molecular chaperone DnaJ [Defluviitaleaceae bacterium]|nr:molecular chaperone DnaJ [Defluviitaleaceae bacterium]